MTSLVHDAFVYEDETSGNAILSWYTSSIFTVNWMLIPLFLRSPQGDGIVMSGRSGIAMWRFDDMVSVLSV